MFSFRRLGRRLNVSWLFPARSLLGSKRFWMGSPPACAKCKRGGAAEGDSWCSGCIAVGGVHHCLEGLSGGRPLTVGLLKASWCRQVSNFGRWKIWDTTPYKAWVTAGNLNSVKLKKEVVSLLSLTHPSRSFGGGWGGCWKAVSERGACAQPRRWQAAFG